LREGTIRATQIWKRFRAGQHSTYLQDELSRLMERVRGGRNGAGWRWALRDVEIEAEPGASIGLVGPNGSGKSTLLKILTRVMYPTAGRVEVAGRVGAMIEVASGIHPNLTGRENVYLTGSLMGLGRRRVAERFDEIVAFADLEDAVDRQVKYYSSGMQMRLGFGVAAFLEPDVLLVDEVLAVGDAAFQQRCLDRMRYVLGQGTTLIFVSHDLAAVEATCRSGVWLNNGDVLATGPVREVLSAYRQAVEADAEAAPRVAGRIRVQAKAAAPDGGMIRTNGPLDVHLAVETEAAYTAWVYIGISEGTASPIFCLNPGSELRIPPGRTEVSCSIPQLALPRGRYYVWLTAHELGGPNYQGQELLAWQPAARFDVFGPELQETPRAVVRLAPVYVESNWAVK
jgi:ABC-type polysaccharide/polyol phosphate transport system ATPase subunit